MSARLDAAARVDRAISEAEHATKAAEMWAAMSAQERKLARFGMFPAAAMRAAMAEGYGSREMAVALMNQAEANGGMIA